MRARLAVVQQWLWSRDQQDRLSRAAAVAARYCVMLVRDFASGHLSLRAMSLVYTTLLSLVPMLALGFSTFKALGVHNALRPALQRFLAPLGERAAELTDNIIGFVENIQVGVLGSLGVGLLLYAAVSLIQKVETSFNWIWRIKRPRSLGARFSEYLSVLIVGPFAVFLSVGITASALNSELVQSLAAVEPFGALVYGIAKLLPYFIIVGVFSFLYAFIPNTRVPLHAAFGGGIFAGVLWQSASMGFATFVASSGNYNAIYSSFAILIFLLIWLYVGWVILLLGCQLSFYIAHPESVQRNPRSTRTPPRTVELLGLALVGEIARRHQAAQRHATRPELARALMAPAETIEPIVDDLIAAGVLAETAANPPLILPARDLDSLRVGELWQILRDGGRRRERLPGSAVLATAESALSSAEAAFDAEKGRLSIREWLQSEPDTR
ncbi:YihY/virulence factor BrkB family protein [Algiphilus sp.]|uniref:YihY/virulence factor BrkB family protein n=1 Tax=Algiphilus sp. TaxID=1872431 RepID=UPI0025BBB196|nr:YihY/virulence factor BrkB family protein [Algiphilus sp.]MCK5769371.1 YihY/virulence factor BrkB family protein [Algiphilus sp.]